MTPAEIRDILHQSFPDAEVHCKDLTGTGDHWELTVVSEAFEGKRLLAQHRLVKDALGTCIKGGVIHALSLKLFTPERWKSQESSS